MNYETILYVIWIFKFSNLLFNEKFLVQAKIVGSNFPFGEYGGQGSDGDLHGSQIILPIHGNPGKAVDSRNEGCSVHPACKS